MNSKARVHPILFTSLIGFAAAGGFSTAQAQVMCGDVITTSEVLSADLSCSGFNPALTIQGPGGRLNMRRFTLSCEGSAANGIQMTNTGPRLRNCTVANCRFGIVVVGARAQVSRMILQDNSGDGLVVSSSDSRISDSTAIDNNIGFEIGDDGGDNNFINRNRATNNTLWGFAGFDDNHYTRNVATGNGLDGFIVINGNTLSRNTSNQNGRDGFTINRNNTLNGNTARGNFDDGIDVSSGARNNTLSGNTASGNGSADTEGNGGFDLEDDNVNCDNNTWTNNTGTRSQACIR